MLAADEHSASRAFKAHENDVNAALRFDFLLQYDQFLADGFQLL